MSQFEHNLSEGNVFKRLVLFSLPFLLSNIIQSLYSVADMLIVGNFSGTASMSGVNIGGQVTFILTNFIAGLCTGGSVLISQYLGSKRREQMEKAVATLITALLVASVFFTVLMLVFSDAILRLISTPEESFAEASRYLFVTVLGIVFIFGYNALCAILRGMGDSKRPLYFVMIAAITNVVLDILLVGPLKMAAMGAAIATVFSQGLSVLLCVIYLKRKGFIFDFRLRSFRMDKQELRKILRIGLPSALQNSVVAVSFLFITAFINVIGGVTASAAVGVVAKFNGFAIMPAVAMSASIATLSAQNIGAGKWDRALQSCKAGMIISVSLNVLIFAVAQLFPQAILELFDRNPKMIADGVIYLRTFSFDYLIVPFLFCLNGMFIGAGHTTFSLFTSMVASLLVRIPASYFLGVTMNLGLRGVGMGAPVASCVSLLINAGFFFSGKWKVNRVTQDTPMMIE